MMERRQMIEQKFHRREEAHRNAQKEIEVQKVSQPAEGEEKIQLLLTSTGNQHQFTGDSILCSIGLWLESIQFGGVIKITREDIVVATLAPTGPYLVGLVKGFAEDLLEEGQLLILDDTVSPAYTQTFYVRLPHAQSGGDKGFLMADKVLSICYELDNFDHLGPNLAWNQLQLPLERIKQVVHRVFGQPNERVEFVYVQPRT